MFHDRLIAASESAGRFQRSYNLVPSRRIEVIHNFPDHQHFAEPALKTGRDVRSAFGVGTACIPIGTVGDAIPSKGLIYLIGRQMPKIESFLSRAAGDRKKGFLHIFK